MIRKKFPDSYHWFPKKSKYVCIVENLDPSPFVIVLDSSKMIVSVCIPQIAYYSGTSDIVVLATHPANLRNGYGKTDVHFALTYIKQQCLSGTFGFWADTFVGDEERADVMF